MAYKFRDTLEASTTEIDMTLKQLTIPLAATGEVPGAALGEEFGGRDDYTLRDWTHTAGYMDAPELLPAGSTINCNYDEVPMGRLSQR